MVSKVMPYQEQHEQYCKQEEKHPGDHRHDTDDENKAEHGGDHRDDEEEDGPQPQISHLPHQALLQDEHFRETGSGRLFPDPGVQTLVDVAYMPLLVIVVPPQQHHDHGRKIL